MKFLHQLWANDQHLTGVLCNTVFKRIFSPLIESYLENSINKGIPYTNLVDLVNGIGKKNRFLLPNETRAKNKNLTKKMLLYLSGNERENGDVDMHKTLIKKFLNLIREMYVETKHPGLGALRCDITIALKEDGKSQLVEQGVDRCHEVIELVDNVRKLNYISPEILKSLKRKVSQIIKFDFGLHPLSDVPDQLIFKTLDGSEITIKQQKQQQRAANLGVEGYPQHYAKIKKFDPVLHIYTASENAVVKTIAKRFKIHPKQLVRINKGFIRHALSINSQLKNGTALRIPTPSDIQYFNEVDEAVKKLEKEKVRQYMLRQTINVDTDQVLNDTR